MKISEDGLKSAIDAIGYVPELVWEVLETALAGESVEAFLVHSEPTMSAGAVGSHVTVLTLTPTRLIGAHVDDHVPGPDGEWNTAATTDAVALRAVRAVGLTHMIGSGPAQSRSVTLAISWGAMPRIELEPATCGDPDCEAEHGFTGSLNSDDIVIRVSEAADGRQALDDAIAFARALSRATARR
jgi:hypothetical protein